MAGRPKQVVRRDPPRKRSFAGYDPTKLLNADPQFRYKFVDPSAKMDGVRSHESRGWEIVLRTKDGPVLMVGTEAREAEPIDYEGMILMRLPKEAFERVDREGQHGQGGQDLLDAIDEQITNPGGLDGLGASNRYGEVLNETKPTVSFDSAAI
jgi:hypothetical protein